MNRFAFALPALLLAAACVSEPEPSTPPPQTASACDALEPGTDRQMCRHDEAEATRDNRLIYESSSRGLPLDLCDQVPDGCIIPPTREECALHPDRCKTRPTEPL